MVDTKGRTLDGKKILRQGGEALRDAGAGNSWGGVPVVPEFEDNKGRDVEEGVKNENYLDREKGRSGTTRGGENQKCERSEE